MRLWAWEEELVEVCMTLLLTVSLQVDINDTWIWIPDLLTGYIVRGAYRILTDGTPLNPCGLLVSDDILWRKDVPIKVFIFVWRLFGNRLPTKANLFRRGIIHFEDQMCAGGCGMQETNDHLYLNCGFFDQVWKMVQKWLGAYTTLSSNTSDNLCSYFHHVSSFLIS